MVMIKRVGGIDGCCRQRTDTALVGDSGSMGADTGSRTDEVVVNRLQRWLVSRIAGNATPARRYSFRRSAYRPLSGDFLKRRPRHSAYRTPNGQKFIAVTSRSLSGQHGKLVQMPGEGRVEETGTESETYPIIVRWFEACCRPR